MALSGCPESTKLFLVKKLFYIILEQGATSSKLKKNFEIITLLDYRTIQFTFFPKQT